MVSLGETSGNEQPRGPYALEVDMRGKQMAYEYADVFAKKRRGYLESIKDLMVDGGLESAVERARVEAADKMLAYREAGLANDWENETPGIWVTGRLDYRKVNDLKEILGQRLKEEYSFESDLIVDNISEIADDQTLGYQLHLPTGAFQPVSKDVNVDSQREQRFILIFTNSRINTEGIIVDNGPGLPMLHGGYVDQANQNVVGIIARIEGADGSLWQNPSYNPDGSRRETQPSEVAA